MRGKKRIGKRSVTKTLQNSGRPNTDNSLLTTLLRADMYTSFIYYCYLSIVPALVVGRSHGDDQ